MTEEPEGSWIAQIACVVLFGGIGIASVWMFFAECHHIFIQVSKNPDSFDLNKGLLYGLGFGVMGLVMAYAITDLTILGNPVTRIRKKITDWTFLAGVISLPAVPQITHFSLDRYLSYNGYVICEEQSYTWFFYKHLIYVKDKANCS